MSVNTTEIPTGASSIDSQNKDMLLIIASVAMVVATVSLIIMVRFLERCIPQDRRIIEMQAQKEERVRLILEKHSVSKKYEDWIADERRKHAEAVVDGQIDLESTGGIKSMHSRVSHATEVWASDCAVCLTEFEKEEEIRELPCDHIFHDACIRDWFMKAKSAVCPLCRNLLHSGLSMENIPTPSPVDGAEPDTTVQSQSSIPQEPQPLPIVNS